MALQATVHRVVADVSDVDRGVYASLDFRVARHPSESARYLVTRILAYCLCQEDGLAFSKGGLSTAEEPPLAVHDPTGRLLAFIDIGSPSAERMHKAAKAAPRVIVFTTSDLAALRAEAPRIHRAASIEVVTLDAAFVDALAERLAKQIALSVTRSDGVLYVTIAGATHETTLREDRLAGA